MEKMTNAKALTYVLTNCEMPSDVAEKLAKMLEQTEKKNHGERKPTAVQVANEDFKSAILNGMDSNRLYTIGEMIKEIPEISDLSNQRVSALVRQLVLGGQILRTEVKRKAYFELALSEDEDA